MRLLTLGVAVALTAACGGKHTGTYEKLQAAGDAAAVDPKLAEADALWEQRVDPEKLAQSLAAYEDVVQTQPDNRAAYERLVRGWYFYGDAHTTSKEEQIERWGHAIEWGTRCLALNDELTRRLREGEKERDAVAAARPEDAPCLYWTSSALGKWSKAQSLSKTLKNLPTVKAYIGAVESFDPEYWHYGPARYWGAYYSVLPSFAGQDPAKSAEFFDASIQGAPAYLGTRVLRAELLHVLRQDPVAFKADLDFVIAADPDALPGAEAENRMEQAKAAVLLDKMNEFFDKKTLEDAGL